MLMQSLVLVLLCLSTAFFAPQLMSFLSHYKQCQSVLDLTLWCCVSVDSGINSRHQTFLHFAALHNHTSWLASALLDKHNATVSVEDIDGNTPLHLAAQSGTRKVARLLLRKIKAAAKSKEARRKILNKQNKQGAAESGGRIDGQK